MRLLLAASLPFTPGAGPIGCLAEGLRARGHEVWVAAPSPRGVAPGPAVPLPAEGVGGWRTVAAGVALVRGVRRHRIQVVYAADAAVRSVARLATQWQRVALTAAPEADPDVGAVERACRSAYVQASRREIPILCYHRLIERDDEAGKFNTHLRVDKFEAQLRYLRDHGYRTLHLADVDRTQVFDPAQPSIVLTFDDGYEDNYRLLFPLLKQYQAKAVIYLVPGCERNEWDIGLGEKPLRLMTPAQRQEMLASGLVEFGAHTVTHVDLSVVSTATAQREIVESKRQLEAELGRPVETFAYPYGRLSAAARDMCRAAGFRYALATNSGSLAIHDDPFRVRRIVVFPSITLQRFRRKVSGRYVQRETVTPPPPSGHGDRTAAEPPTLQRRGAPESEANASPDTRRV